MELEQMLAGGQTIAQAAQAMTNGGTADESTPPPATDGQFSQDQSPPSEIPEYMTRDQAKSLLETERRRWESGVTSKLQLAKNAEQLADSLKNNPRGTLLYLADRYGVNLTPPDEPRTTPSRVQAQEEEAYHEQVRALREKAKNAQDFDTQWEVFDKLTDLKADKRVRESVRPVQQTLMSNIEEREIQDLEKMGINAREIYPQIKRYQSEIVKSPYVRPTEAAWTIVGPGLLKEVQELRARVARPAVTAQEKMAGTVAGGGAAAPQGTPDARDLPFDKLEGIMRQQFPEQR